MNSSEASQRTGPERWPHPLLQFFWDLLPARFAPENSGLVAPPYKESEIARESSSTAPEHQRVLRDVANAAAVAAHERVEHAEARASRLANVTLTLFGVSLALVAYQFSSYPSTTTWTLRGLTLAAIFFLALAAIEALEVDRVHLTNPPAIEDVANPTDFETAYLRAEDRDRQLVQWSAKNKLSRLLQARAWFSRGILLLLISAALTASLVPPKLDKAEPAGQKTPQSHETPGANIESGLLPQRVAHPAGHVRERPLMSKSDMLVSRQR